MPDIQDVERRIEDMLVSALTEYDQNRDRSQQSKRGGLGMSSLGFCRNYAVLTLRQTKHDEPDVPPEGIQIQSWPAQVGSAVHEWIDHALDGKDVVLGSKIDKVTATFPQSGTTVSGHFDLYLPNENVLLDVKTKNRLGYVKRTGPDQNMVFQRHAYTMGLIDAGIARDDGTLMVGNAFFDRSGVDSRPYVVLSSYDPTLTPQVDMWIEDVLYAYQHNEAAQQDKPFDFCERFCEFFTSCRGVMEDTHDPTLILDSEAIDAVAQYRQGVDMEREGKKKKEEVKHLLMDVNGLAVLPSGERYQVRQVEFAASEFKRSGGVRLDVKRMRA